MFSLYDHKLAVALIKIEEMFWKNNAVAIQKRGALKSCLIFPSVYI
jgi:hypothetical protein